MHAGEARDGRGQRAHGGKLYAVSVETSKPAEKWEEKCTPVRRGRAEASVHKEANCTPPSSKRPSRRRNRMKNARRRGEEVQRPACKRRQNARRHRRDAQAGGETE
ncbi:hypothetical protein [Bianquea renquensis]|uniref:Uncharacterized protein n=1 Tax=Bianquea renquensis TaxID=2763661 RepID=A0A926I137_9FIRM|nr:hypothetical protein [Bianquea renquensis]MBC8542870.1 hypothetical protein [Bianquea renquensis]